MKRYERDDPVDREYRDYDQGRITTETRPGSWRFKGYRGYGPKNYRRSDEWIREDAAAALTEDAWVDAREIEIEVTDGIVLLKGNIPSRRMKRAAEDCVERIRGVKDIRNELVIRSDKRLPLRSNH